MTAVAPAGVIAAASGLLAASMSSWGYALMYAALALMLAALGLNAWRSGRAHALVLGLVAAVAVLAAFHEAWDVTVFAGLIWGGAVALIAAVACDIRLGARACRMRQSEAG